MEIISIEKMAPKRKAVALSEQDRSEQDDGKRVRVEQSSSSFPDQGQILHFLVCKQGGSDKFYEITLMGKSVLSRYGRTGSKGATVVKDFSNPTEAYDFIESIVQEKIKKGYKAKDIPVESSTTSSSLPLTASSCRTIVAKSEPLPVDLTAPTTVSSQAVTDDNTEVHYLECKTGGSNKFYELTVKKNELVVQTRYGRIGSSGAISRKFFTTIGELQLFVSATLNDKLSKGYEGYVDMTSTQLDDEFITEDVEEELMGKPAQKATVKGEKSNGAISPPTTTSSSVAAANSTTNETIFYLECKEGSSNKFYEIAVKDCDVTIRYGRIGAPGNPTTKSFPSQKEAMAFAEKTAKEKRNKGYKETKNEIQTTFVPTENAMVVGDDGPIDIDACENPAEELEKGRIILVQGSGKTPYKVKKFVGGYSCSCPGWIFQVKPKGAQRASCKHLRSIRGEDAEEERCGNAAVTSAAVTGSKNSSILSKITLAQQWKSGQNPKGYLMSEKLDGMRAYWTNGKLWTRNGNEIIAPDWFIAGLPQGDDLDGELFLGRQRFEDCMSIARRTDASNDWKQLKYVIFDCPTAPGGITDRLKRAETLLAHSGNTYAILHPHTVCESEEELLLKLTEIEKVGGEGLMLRHPTAKHRGGRNTDLLKVKTFMDDEALVLDHESGKGKYEGMVGSLICINKAGTRFKVGSGLSDDIRSYRTAPQVGSVITFKYFELTRDGVPRFPTFMRIRPDVDASIFPK